MGSARQASAQEVQTAAQSWHSSMQRRSLPAVWPFTSGWVAIICWMCMSVSF